MERYITNEIIYDGFGSRVSKLICIIGENFYLKSIGLGKEFVYTPLDYETNESKIPQNMPLLYKPSQASDLRLDYLSDCDRWERTLNVKGLRIYNVDFKEVKFLHHPIGGYHNQSLYDEIRKVRSKILDLFSLPRTDKKDYIDIAIHIRRGDVSNGIRWLSDNYYLAIIDILSNFFGDKCKITIYSQRNNFNQIPYEKYNLKIVYDDQSLDNEIWVKLIGADILVMGKSTFSYSAALLSDGICIYPVDVPDMSWFHPKVYDWIDKNNLLSILKNKYE